MAVMKSIEFDLSNEELEELEAANPEVRFTFEGGRGPRGYLLLTVEGPQEILDALLENED